MSHTLCVRLANSPEGITSTLEAATKWLAPLNISHEARDFARLAIEELATNWMKYGCAEGGRHAMVFDLSVDAGKLVLRATDDSPPFNPMHAPQPPIHEPVEQRHPGGLGILLLRKMADQMSYEYSGGNNILTLEKSFL